MLLVLAALLFGLMAVVAKRATLELPGPEVAFLRFLVGLVAVAIAGSTFIRLRPVNLRGLFLRGFFGGLAVLLYFLAIEHLAVGTATLLNYTAPVFTAIDAAIFLGEAVSGRTIIALGLTLLGVVLVVHGHAPPSVGSAEALAHGGSRGFALGCGPWELAAIGSAILSGAAVTAIRAARRTDGPWEIFGAFCVFGALATLPFALSRWVWPSPTGWLLALLVGLISVAAQVMMTHALREVRAATVGVILQVTPVTALLLGAVLYREPLGPESLLGSAITVAGAALAAIGSKPARPRAPAAPNAAST